MEIGNLRGANDILPALLPRNTAATSPAPSPAVVPAEPLDVFSPSDESRSVAAFVAKAQAQALADDRADQVAAARTRLQNGELDGSQIARSTAEKVLQALRDQTLD